MAKGISYRHAVRLLGGEDNKILSALDKVAGGVLLGGSAGAPGVLALLGAKAEVVRLGQELLRKLSERRGGLSRYNRTQRLEAAHAVLVVSAYFEAMEETDLPFRFTDLELTKAEQVAMVADDSWRGRTPTHLVEVLLSAGPGFFQPQFTHESYLVRLRFP